MEASSLAQQYILPGMVQHVADRLSADLSPDNLGLALSHALKVSSSMIRPAQAVKSLHLSLWVFQAYQGSCMHMAPIAPCHSHVHESPSRAEPIVLCTVL